MLLDRRRFLSTAVASAAWSSRSKLRGDAPPRPNIVFINSDDLGYGDLGCYGSKIPTPNIDQMAAEGVRFTQYYAASNICSPSRAALLTGRYATRVGVPYVLSLPNTTSGLSMSETTMAQSLKAAGYFTVCVGKWHLGVLPQYMPTHRGFDQFFGIPYSNDTMPLPLMQGDQVVENSPGQDTLLQRFTQRAIDSIGSRPQDSPFFLYLAYSAPHIPLVPSGRFRGSTRMGTYADVVAELDWGVGQVLQALKDNGIDQNTLVVFSSDHGPWYQGSAGNFRGRKAETWEGGFRVPFLTRLPGVIQGGSVCNGVATALDILPTFARLANAPQPTTVLDGVDIWPMLSGQQTSVDREVFLYFDGWNLQCARWGKWKLHVARNNTPAWSPIPAVGGMNLPLPAPELYDLEADPCEASDCADDNPDIVAQIKSRIAKVLPTFPAEVQAAWNYTMTLRVGYAPSGALPTLQTP
jgi:arylsulfatase A